MTRLPKGFAWHQSGVSQYHRCPRQFFLEHVEGRRIDHVSAGYAAPIGTAVHAGAEMILRAAKADQELTRDQLETVITDAFMEAVIRAQTEGHNTDPDTVAAACDRLTGEQLEQLVRLQADPRVHAVSWERIEHPFRFEDRFGRIYQGRIDAAGLAREWVEDFGADGRERFALEPGQRIVCDWKSGKPQLGFVARSANPQVNFYSRALAQEGWHADRAYIGALADLSPSKRPKDDQGNPIPKMLKTINPDFAAAVGLPPEEAASSKKRPRGVPKWIEAENPAWVEAQNRPKGPLFHECRTDEDLAGGLIRSAIRGAERGDWPATGALTGECGFCPFRGSCAHADTDHQHEGSDEL